MICPLILIIIANEVINELISLMSSPLIIIIIANEMK